MDTLILAPNKAAAQLPTSAVKAYTQNVVLAFDFVRADLVCAERDFGLFVVVGEGVDAVQAAKAFASKGCGGVLCLSATTKAQAEALRRDGVAVLPPSSEADAISAAAQAIVCGNARIQKLQEERRTLLKKMDALRIVDRAKLILMQTMGYTEAQAHKYIERRAMDERVPRVQIAINILKTYEV